MDKKLPHIPVTDAANHEDLRTGPEEGPRAMFAPHTMNHDGELVVVYPANQMFVAHMRDADSDELRPVLRMHMATGRSALLFIPTVEEMRALAASLTHVADEEERISNEAAAAAIARAMGKRS